MARFDRWAPIGVALVSFAISIALASFTPLPAPQFHDEFSYLLAGDTFARGRLTNRPHELWEFFETFQVIQRPTYMSKYPPGQGLVLALGQVLADEAIVGVWISTALAAAAVWWALAGFVPRRWATLGAIGFATHPLVLEWNWSYWGGAAAVIGGAVVVGGIARLRRSRRPGGAAALGVGLFILIISRPFEGIVFAVLCALLLRPPSPQPSPGGRGGRAVALVATLIIGVAWLGYYNWRVTGSAVRLPYMAYEAEYAVTPPFLWIPRVRDVPEYRHEVMRDYYLGWELPQYQRQRTPAGLLRAMGEKMWSFARGYFYSLALLVPAVASLALARRSRTIGRAWAVAVMFTLVVLGNLWFFPHYAAPAVVVYLLIVIQGLRSLRHQRGGRWIVGGVLALHVLSTVTWIAQLDRGRSGWNHVRADLIAQARDEGRKLLVIVRPGEGYYAHNEWVYNDADIDASPVVWARDMGERNRELLEYFGGREVLQLEITAQSMRFDALPR